MGMVMMMVRMMGMRRVVVVLNTGDDMRRDQRVNGNMERRGLRGLINLDDALSLWGSWRRRRRRRDGMEIGARGGDKLGSSSVEPAKRNVSRQTRI